jgi:AraC family transcriptional regulator
MDWLGGMNFVLQHIENNLTENITYEGLSKIVGVSVYEFSRIFSFMAEMPVSEYIRRRRLSQAVYDIQRGTEKIIDVAYKYRYESPTTFSRAFKEMHGTSPASARKSGAKLKMYPPISFILQIKGVGPLDYRIEKREAFPIIGLVSYLTVDDNTDGPASLWNASMNTPIKPEGFGGTVDSWEAESDKPEWTNHSAHITDTKTQILVGVYDKQGKAMTNTRLTAAIDYASENGKVKAVIGLTPDDLDIEMPKFHNVNEPDKNEPYNVVPNEPDEPEPDIDITKLPVIPASDWAVFTFTGKRNVETMAAAYARILTEWFTGSGYKRREDMPHLEKFAVNDSEQQTWEIWMPVR